MTTKRARTPDAPTPTRPEIGEIWHYTIDGKPRPFLVVLPGEPLVGGWLFPGTGDEFSAHIKQVVADPARRRQPCYLVVPVADLSRD